MRILITAGPTREAIDDVRFLTSGSTGRMGYVIAAAARDAGHDVILVTGPVPLSPPEGVETVPVVSALDMHDAVLDRFADVDAVVMVAAVADYRPESRIHGKRKKTDGPWDLRLVRNPDILAELGRRRKHQVLVGFALEAENGEANARKKLAAKGCDAIVLDSPATVGADVSDFTILTRDGGVERLREVAKAELARRLVAYLGSDPVRGQTP
jgi:phosphopantothenoylcysteine decarboxylase/phosphopantothenate--cysteine ligase